MSKYLDDTGLSYFYQKLKTKFAKRSQSIPVIAGIDRNETTGAMELWSQDLNDVTKTGLYNAMTCTNAKFQYSTLIVIGYYLTGYCTQIQQDVTTGNLATRSQINGTWSKWVEIDTSAFYTKSETDTALLSKVDVENGKGLSSNDYTAAEKAKLGATNVAYGTCSTAAATAAKVVTISGNDNWTLTNGAIIAVHCSYTNTAKNPTLNVGGSGAYPIRYNTANLTTASLSYATYANRTHLFMFNGSAWVFLGWSIDNNTTYTNMTQAEATTGTATSARTISAKVLNTTIDDKISAVALSATDDGNGTVTLTI